MPEMTFRVKWPDGKQVVCYSPSLVVKDYLKVGESYTVSDFLARSRESLTIASNRVQAKYGFPCSRALGQLRQIEETAKGYLQASQGGRAEGEVVVVAFE